VTIRLLIVGGTGTTGSRLARRLADQDVAVRIATRRPAAAEHVRFDWADVRSHPGALTGVDAIYLVAPIGVTEPAAVVEPFLATALHAGVRRVVLLSSSAVPESDTGLGALARLVRTSVPEWTVLRPSWFMQNFLGDHPVGTAVRGSGEIVTATGDGRVAFIDAADIAAVAARALTDEEPHNTAHVLTGPEALSYADAAAVIAEVTGRPVRHCPVDPAELIDRLVAAGHPRDFAEVLAVLDADISTGAEDRVTTTVPDLTGRPARRFADFAREAFS
jgi:uncharacterized protein YbjT (DUF2867 family)